MENYLVMKNIKCKRLILCHYLIAENYLHSCKYFLIIIVHICIFLFQKVKFNEPIKIKTDFNWTEENLCIIRKGKKLL